MTVCKFPGDVHCFTMLRSKVKQKYDEDRYRYQWPVKFHTK